MSIKRSSSSLAADDLRARLGFLSSADPEAQRIIFAVDDIRAVLALLNRAEREYSCGNMRGAARLFHAEAYLMDRSAYILDPIRARGPILVAVFRGGRARNRREISAGLSKAGSNRKHR